MSAQGNRYRVILADPPWAYNVFGGKHRYVPDTVASAKLRGNGAAIAHYQTARVDEIATLPVSTLAARDCALFMWATYPCMPEAMQLMRAWGFTYKTAAFTWVKLTERGTPFVGLGHYTRANAEVCLLGMRGRMKRTANDVQQVILSRRREHSRKPDEQYERIMRLFDGPYLELFARQQWPGWDVWGNQTGKFPAQPFLMPEVV